MKLRQFNYVNSKNMKLSPYLEPIYNLELSLGNEVERIDEPSWSNCPYGIYFKDKLHFEEIKEKLNLPPFIKYWENKDSHYSLEAGFLCKETMHLISGPLVAKGFYRRM